MATMTFEIPDGVERKLQARAAAQGRDIASVALELVEQGLCEEREKSGQQPLSHEEWLKEFDAWVNSHPKVDVVLDVSRESIYEGRGQ